MVIAAVFAGGKGSRMGNTETPKQYMMLGKKPIIVHTIEKFYINSKIDKVIVLSPAIWVEQTKDLVKKYIGDTEKGSVILSKYNSDGTLVKSENTASETNQLTEGGAE